MSKTKLLLNVVSDLRSLANSVQAVADAIESESGIQSEATATNKEEKRAAKTVTLEEVRAVLAGKSHDGFTAEIRSLLEKYGAPKLSEIDPAKYAALLVDAEGLK